MDERSLLRFSEFEIDLRDERVRRADAPVALTPKAFALLRTLLQRPGQLVTKDELFARVWSRRYVTDDALARCMKELRAALGDDARQPRFIQTVHGRGFRFVAPVVRPASAPHAAPDPAPVLVGRASELEILDAALRESVAGARRVLFVTGEAGIGKTSLVEAFLARHAAAGDALWVAQGRCIDQYGAGEPYMPLLEALERLGQAMGTDRLAAALRQHAPTWLGQLLLVSEEFGGAAAAGAALDRSPQRMVRELAYAFEALSRERPIVLWLEDLHWSDYATLDFVSFIAARRGAARLLVLGTYRPADVLERGHPLREVTAHLAMRGECRELPLGLLSEASIAEYLARRLAGRASLDTAGLARSIHRRSDGNALFMVAVADQIEQEDASLEEKLTRVPASLRQLIERQLDRLSRDEQHLLEVASLAGAEFPAAAVAAGLEWEVAAVEERCVRLVRRGQFLRPAGTAEWPDGMVSARFGFLHALYQEVLAERTSGHRRPEIQRRIGEREERAYGARAPVMAAQLAARFAIARDMPRAVRYLEHAGKNALARHAYVEAAQHLSRGLELVDQLPEEGRQRQALDLYLPLGAALMASSGYASPATERTYQRALALCRGAGTQAELVRVVKGLWNVLLVRGELVAARAMTDELLRAAQESGDATLMLDAHARLGQTAFHAGELRAAHEHLERASRMLHDTAARSRHAGPRVVAYLSWVEWYLGHPERAAVHGREALERAAQLGNAHSIAFTLGFIGWLHLFRGEAARARELANEQLALCAEHGLRYWQSWATFLRGAAVCAETPEADTLARMAEAVAAHRETGAEIGVAFFQTYLADAHRRAGRVDEGLTIMDEALKLISVNGNRYHEADAHRVRGELLLQAGATEEAQRCFEHARDIARSQSARSLELRAAISLLRCAPPRRRAPARAALRRVLATFAQDEETGDLREARAAAADVAASRGARPAGAGRMR